MKNNRRSRALKYIKAKNLIRKGLPIFNYAKISNEMKDNDSFIESEQKHLVDYTIREMGKKWKLKFDHIETVFVQDSDDFLKNLTTMRIKIRLK